MVQSGNERWMVIQFESMRIRSTYHDCFYWKAGIFAENRKSWFRWKKIIASIVLIRGNQFPERVVFHLFHALLGRSVAIAVDPMAGSNWLAIEKNTEPIIELVKRVVIRTQWVFLGMVDQNELVESDSSGKEQIHSNK